MITLDEALKDYNQLKKQELSNLKFYSKNGNCAFSFNEGGGWSYIVTAIPDIKLKELENLIKKAKPKELISEILQTV